jgi:hypothetical protein
MDPIKNPYSPGAGSPPPELVGRDPILEQARVLLGRIKQKRAEKSLMLTGLRGVGKTVLLNEIERQAKANGYRTIAIEAYEDKPLGPLLAPSLRSLLFELDRLAGAAVRGIRYGLRRAGGRPVHLLPELGLEAQAANDRADTQGD